MKHSVHPSNWACMHILRLVNEFVHNYCQWILFLDQVNIIIKFVVDWTLQGRCKQTLSHPPVCRNQYCQAKPLTGQGHSPTNSRWTDPKPTVARGHGSAQQRAPELVPCTSVQAQDPRCPGPAARVPGCAERQGLGPEITGIWLHSLASQV